jgi:hypothetical protein
MTDALRIETIAIGRLIRELYPSDYFVVIDLPKTVEQAILRQS